MRIQVVIPAFIPFDQGSEDEAAHFGCTITHGIGSVFIQGYPEEVLLFVPRYMERQKSLGHL